MAGRWSTQGRYQQYDHGHSSQQVWPGAGYNRKSQSIDRQLQQLQKQVSRLFVKQPATSKAQAGTAPAKSESRCRQTLCTEKPTHKTCWICNECACPHDNNRKLVCRFCGHKRVVAPTAEVPSSAPAAAGCNSPAPDSTPVPATSAMSPSASPSAGPISKGWAVALLRKRGVEATPTTATSQPLAPPSETKREKLLHSIEVAKEAGASDAVITALQSDLNSMPEPKVGQDEMDQGKLLQLRAKQQAHHQAELDALNSELSAIQLQIDVLSAKASQLQENAKQLAIAHQSNMTTIDQAIAKIDSPAISHSLSLTTPSAPVQPTTAQVVSQSLQEALRHQDFCGADPQTAEILRLFLKKVVELEAVKAVSPATHFASDLPSSVASTISAPMLSTSSLEADIEMSEDANNRSFVGISG